MQQLLMFSQPGPATTASVAGCRLIYEPKGRAREYAALACNVYRGCDHRCEYCFAPSATRRTREEFTNPALRPGFLGKLRQEASKYHLAGIEGQVLLSFTCDPYPHIDAQYAITREAIKIIHSAGLSVCVLTKGGSRALRDLDLFSGSDAFATTMTFLDEAQSLKWEPGAAIPADRVAAIQEFHAAEIPTWVSLEPVLDPAAALDIIRETHGFVDLYKVGRLNYHPLAKTIDWRQFAHDAVDLLESLGCAYYLKKDLACHLSNTAA